MTKAISVRKRLAEGKGGKSDNNKCFRVMMK